MILASVVVATYNRREPLARLLATLAEQSVGRDQFEVVVVDDGSREDATPIAAPFAGALDVSVLRQDNSGVAVARDRGTRRARGRVVIFLDDDMLVGRDFVAQHLEAHGDARDRVVMGELLPDERLAEMPLFERFHAHHLAKNAERYGATGTFGGHEVYTGNLSLPRELFLRVGGFDPTFFIEDVELGVRLERAGARFVFSRAAAAVHASDHASLERWLDRCRVEGRDWVRLARRHPTVHAASPWSFLSSANPLSRAVFAAAVAAPGAVPGLARATIRGALAADALGLRRGTIAAMTLVYGLQYYRGVREETGSAMEALGAYLSYRRREERQRAGAPSERRGDGRRATHATGAGADTPPSGDRRRDASGAAAARPAPTA